MQDTWICPGSLQAKYWWKEFAYLRAIALFGADHHSVEQLQDKAISELVKYCNTIHPGDKNRFQDFFSFFRLCAPCIQKRWRIFSFPDLLETSRLTVWFPTFWKWSPGNIKIILADIESFSPEPRSPASPVKTRNRKLSF